MATTSGLRVTVWKVVRIENCNYRTSQAEELLRRHPTGYLMSCPNPLADNATRLSATRLSYGVGGGADFTLERPDWASAMETWLASSVLPVV
jgi:hypothetical protein